MTKVTTEEFNALLPELQKLKPCKGNEPGCEACEMFIELGKSEVAEVGINNLLSELAVDLKIGERKPSDLIGERLLSAMAMGIEVGMLIAEKKLSIPKLVEN